MSDSPIFSELELIRQKLKVYAEIMRESNPNIDKKELMLEMQRLAFKLQESNK